MRRRGFTLLEMLAVMFLMSVVVTVAVNVYLDLSRQSAAAAEQTRSARRAAALLDRIARDLEGAMLLVKAPETDPLDHPWLFLGEETGGDGAGRIKFVTRNRPLRGSEGGQSNLAMVAYQLRDAGPDRWEILRWSSPFSPGFPEGLDRSFPGVEDEGSFVLADDVAGFAVRFLSEGEGWKDSWDSSSFVESGELPLAAEIALSLYEGEDDVEDPAVAGPFVRRVMIPVRPLDLAGLLEEAEEAEEDDETELMTLRECIEEFELDGEALVAQIQAEFPQLADERPVAITARHAAMFGSLVPRECR